MFGKFLGAFDFCLDFEDESISTIFVLLWSKTHSSIEHPLQIQIVALKIAVSQQETLK